ncbi:MAG TPA: DMT family transporter [Xanthobacteraceae bacterium]|nr:DMT family transporter [Xanthobacteraceae bacterium]
MQRRISKRARFRPALTGPQARIAGIALMCAAVFCFTLLDTTAKVLIHHMSTLQVVWGRYVSHFFLSLIFINPWTTPGILKTKRPWLQIGRSTLLLLSTVFNFIALHFLQLDQTSSIGFTTPLFVALFAGPLLGEWIGPRRWVAILIGFAGVLLVTRPGGGGIHPAAAFSVLSALSYALYSLSTRVLASYDSTATTVFYSALVGAIATSAPLPFAWTTPDSLWLVIAMLTTGVYGWIGHLFLTMAHRRAPAPILAPFMYTQIVWMIASGFLVFGDKPSAWTLAGVAIVIASGLYLLYREQRMKAKESLEAQALVEE